MPNKGIFWLLDSGTLLAFPFKEGAVLGVAKSGNNYNHKLLWEHVKPRHCNKPFDYYPRGRVEINSKGKVVIYMNKNIGEDALEQIMEAFEIHDVPRIHYDGSNHYKCYLD